MAQILTSIHEDHSHYFSLLTIIRIEIEKLENAQDPDFICLYDIMNYLTNYPDVYHHPLEEVIFSCLVKKQPDIAEKMDRLTNEHSDLARLGLTLKENLSHINSGSIVSKNAIVDSANDYSLLLSSHINTEESLVLPLVQKTFGDSDWSWVEKQLKDIEDPLFGEAVQEQFTDLYNRITLSKEEVA